MVLWFASFNYLYMFQQVKFIDDQRNIGNNTMYVLITNQFSEIVIPIC